MSGRDKTARVVVDMAVGTAEELLSCVHDRIARCQQAGVKVPHITVIAGRIIREALGLSHHNLEQAGAGE